MPCHLITMDPSFIMHPSYQMKPVKSFFIEKEGLSNQQGFKAIEALGLAIHTSIMLNEETGCTTWHPKFRNCPFCYSMG
jgi:hypothetical protein